MKQRIARILALLTMILLVVAIAGIGMMAVGAGQMNTVLGWQLLFGFLIGFIVITILMWLGIEMHSPRMVQHRLRHRFLSKLDAAITPLLLSGLSVGAFAFVGKAVFTLIFGPWPRSNPAERFPYELHFTANLSAAIAGIMVFILLILLWERLGFRVQRVIEHTSEKKKRASRIDALFADLSDAEVQELRQRLLAVEDGPITEDYLDDVAGYEEKAKHHRVRRLQSER